MKKLLYSFLVILVLVSCGPKNTYRVIVASQRADCVGVSPQRCLLIKTGASSDWEFLYAPIEGFDYEEGYEYELDVKQVKVDNPPADASSVQYVLVREISKTAKTSANLPPSVDPLVHEQLYQWGGRVLSVDEENIGTTAAEGKLKAVVVKLLVTHTSADVMISGDTIYCELVSSPRVMPVVGREYMFKSAEVHPSHVKGVYFLETDVMDLVV